MVLISAHPFHIKEIYRSSFEYFFEIHLRKHSIEINQPFHALVKLHNMLIFLLHPFILHRLDLPKSV
jgi:hypothetical protein